MASQEAIYKRMVGLTMRFLLYKMKRRTWNTVVHSVKSSKIERYREGATFLDEPTNGLDEAGIKEIRQLIEQEKKEEP